MPNINRSELDPIDNQQSGVWDHANFLLESQDYRIRNKGVEILLYRLSDKSGSQLLEKDEESYREGFNLLLNGTEDENYTVRGFAVTTLAEVLETTEGKEEYEDIYQKALAGVFKAMEDKAPWVSGHAIDIVKEKIKQARKSRNY